MTHLEFWEETVSEGASEAGASLTPEQLRVIAETVMGSHDNFGIAFYEPPPSDRISEIEGEHEKRYKRLQAEFDRYRNNAETAVKQALGQHSDARVGIGEYGEVTRFGGRAERIQ